MKKPTKTMLVWSVLIAAFVVLFMLRDTDTPSDIDYETFLTLVDSGLVADVRVDSNEIIFTDQASGMRLRTLGVMNDELQEKLSAQGIIIEWGEERNLARTVLIFGLPLILLLGFLIYFLRKSQAAWAT